MGYEIWLRTNPRAILLGMIPPGLIALVGLAMVLTGGRDEGIGWLQILGGVCLVAGLLLVAGLAVQWWLPRVAYEPGFLLLRLRSGPPIRVPIEIVECFWLGQTDSMLPGKRHERTETAALVIRLADRATDWRHQDVKPQLGKWCEGYVTVRGTWCEPLSLDLVNRLNQRLADLSRQPAPVSAN